MYELIFKILNMSITASLIAVAVILLRLLLKKTPRWISYALWSVVLFRLICPVSFSSPVSLLGGVGAPAASGGVVSYIPENIVHAEYPQVDLILPGVSEAVNDTLPQGDEQLAADPLEAPAAAAAVIWLLGVYGLLSYGLVSYVLLRRRLSDATLLEDGVFETDAVTCPFVCGILKPRIYLPVGLPEAERGYVLLHERTHICRRDYLIKPLAFLGLAVHWFNPLMWLSFRLMCRDMETSCDERAARALEPEGRAGYSAALLRLASKRSALPGGPLAFGESGVKARVRHILNYKKPAFWLAAAALAAVIAASVFLLANPAGRPGGVLYKDGYSQAVGGGTDYAGIDLSMRALKLDASPTILTVTWRNGSDYDIFFGEHYMIYRSENGRWVSCAAEDDVIFHDVAFDLAPGGSTVKNYYNYSFDLSRTGTYRLETYFYFKKDVPVTEEERQKVWLDFRITEGAPPSAALEPGVYAAEEVLYLSSLNSSHQSDESGRILPSLLYVIDGSGFRIADSETLEERLGYSGLSWQGEAVDLEEWYAMFSPGAPDIGGYASRMEYDTGGAFRLYQMDGEIWLAELNGDTLRTLYTLKKTDISVSDIVGRTGPSIPDNGTLRVDSPDGTYRAEAYGTNKGVTAAGLYPYEGLRVVRNSDDAVLWRGSGYYEAEFLWSGDSRYVAVYGEARTYGTCFVVDARTGNAVELPGLTSVAEHLDAGAQPDGGRPDPYFRALEWQDDTTLRVSYRWTSAEGKDVSGSYTFNIATGDILVTASQ
jgi:beta-lactamase regulating signal transducer with metallopeptidase domain